MISFLNPWLLLGLPLAALPLLLHLLHRRQPPTVVFPAVRYLVDTTREHQRRLRLRNWLLLLVRTVLVLLLVLAAAGPTAPLREASGHAPAALVLVFDNSLSSGAVVNGTPRLEQLRRAALDVLGRATSEDALWLMLSDGVPRRAGAAALSALVREAGPSGLRLDLGAAIRTAEDVLSAQPLPGEVVLVSDLQASALSGAAPAHPLLVTRPEPVRVRNLGLAGLDPGVQPWGGSGGRVTLTATGDSGLTRPVSVRLGDRAPRQALLSPESPVSVAVPGAAAGWWPVVAELDPDELLADNVRVAEVRIAPVAGASWDPAERYVAAAASVLEGNGRLVAGNEVTIGTLGPRYSVVEPPEDAAELGALNRALARRGIGWSYGRLMTSPAATDSGALLGVERVERRYTLVPVSSGRTGVLITAAGEPWMVRSADVVLLGSRLDPSWTGLPLSARFVPFMDALVNRIARGELTLEGGHPGEPVALPDLVTGVAGEGRSWAVEGGAPFRPPGNGIYFLLAGRDTVGALTVNPDPRESRLEPARDAEVRALWPGSEVVGLDAAAGRAFLLGLRANLRGWLLWSALGLGLLEVFLASVWRKRT
ncbi:MAG: VWA domain-containing protein [Gemmatimonadales bacterium]